MTLRSTDCGPALRCGAAGYPPGGTRMQLRITAFPAFLLVLIVAAALPARAQEQGPVPPVDSIAVEGNTRLTAAQIAGTSGIVLGQSLNYRDVQRAITALFKTGQFDDVTAEQRQVGPKFTLVFKVKERPILEHWTIRGDTKTPIGDLKERVKLVDNRPLDRAAVAHGRYAIDSLLKEHGYYAAQVKTQELPQAGGKVRIVFDVDEGSRVAISEVRVEGNTHFQDKAVVGHMATKPEGFWWFRKGEFDERKLEDDLRERLPTFYANNGFVDFQVVHDSLVPDSASGKAVLHLTVDEGKAYHVGHFDITGNRRFSSEELTQLYPFTTLEGEAARPFSRADWEAATERVRTLYANNGYIYSQVDPVEQRRTAADGSAVIDLSWNIREGAPATVNKIDIVGNDVTHERVIREAIVLVPGQVFSRDLLIRSYRNIANLGFFQQPLPPPDVKPSANGQDVDLTFRVEEKRTGNINFGASLGQGTGVGGFLGLEEPNLFGRGKRGKLQWQFGANINDFTLSYTDPAIRESRVSGTVSLFDSRARYTIADLGRRRQTGGSLQLGFPLFGSRYTRVFGTYSLQRYRFTDGSEDIQAAFRCASCTRSSLGGSVLRDTRVGLPFATGGSYTSIAGELNGGFLGGSGNYRKFDFEGRWYAPLGSLGGNGQLDAGVQFVLGLTAKSGFILGDAGPFYTELYSMGGVQYGIPLRGYEEFSITPNGFDPNANGNTAQPTSFGKSYAAFTVEAGARISQGLYISSFMDAGNVYRTARQWDPTHLFRSVGVGAAVVSPLGPIGIDLGYGFDRLNASGLPAPGWKVHFRLGNFF